MVDKKSTVLDWDIEEVKSIDGIYIIWERIKRIFPSKVNEEGILFRPQEHDKMIMFKCKRCGFEKQLPDFVAFESYTPEEFDNESGSPIVLCIKCGSDMIINS